MEVKTTSFEGLMEIIPSILTIAEVGSSSFTTKKLLRDMVFITICPRKSILLEERSDPWPHFQLHPYAQAKLVTVLSGKVLDVVVDFGKDQELLKPLLPTRQCQTQHAVGPRGFCSWICCAGRFHIFLQMFEPINKEAESGIRWNDPELNIDWRTENPIVSAKDAALPLMAELLKNR